MTYRVVHRTRYDYESDVSASYGEAHLHPRETQSQQTYSATLTVEPFPEHYRERRDFFGNRVAHFTVLERHRTLTVTATSMVDVRDRRAILPIVGDLRWEQARDLLHRDPAVETLDARQFVLASPAATPSLAAIEYALPTFAPDRPIVEALEELCTRLHTEFEFAPGSTTVSTPVDDVIAARKGVCQDFAHLMLGALRSLGIPARYVSGYLHPKPDAELGETVEGQSHAWVEWWVGEWVPFDTTHLGVVSADHVLVARGRDYTDVAPLKGIISGAARSELFVTVEVTRVA